MQNRAGAFRDGSMGRRDDGSVTTTHNRHSLCTAATRAKIKTTLHMEKLGDEVDSPFCLSLGFIFKVTLFLAGHAIRPQVTEILTIA
mmetsp:Transcript_18714/g.39364  ORF Transcript_18714/g.39364 Transcript_18714/m.39364 type:complete len:87 (-) Transcript_18714:1858-2118(-)